MSEIMRKSLRRELQATNVGLQLLFDPTQTQSSAIVYLQWCIAKPIADYVREKHLTDAMLFLTVTNPHGREKRYLFDLTSKQELIPFHTSGAHTLRATIVWGVKAKKMRGDLLKEAHGNKSGFEYNLSDLIGKDRRKYQYAIGLKKLGSAELSVEVPAQFFAPELSPLQSWWVNLAFEGVARDSCSIRRRVMLAYTIQIPLVGIWIVLMTIWRFLNAVFFGVLIGLRCDWGAILHPFEQSWRDVFDNHWPNYSWVLKDSGGNKRKWAPFWGFFTPGYQVLLAAMVVGWTLMFSWEFTLLNLALGYLCSLALIGVFVGMIFVIFTTLESGAEMLVKLSNRWKRDKLDSLLCNTAPPVGGLRQVGYSPRLLYQRGKAKFCKPVAT